MIDSSDFRTKRMPLNRGAGHMPVLGFGTLIPDAAATISATRDALEAGFDTWSRYYTKYFRAALPFVAADIAGDPLEWVHCHIARQPIAPVDRRTVPEPLSAITMRLLAKNAEERYQNRLGPGSRSSAMPDGTAVAWSHRSIPSGRGRLVGPIVDTREAVMGGSAR